MHFWKWVGLVLIILLIPLGFFTAYGYILVDYSLENLGLALAVPKEAAAEEKSLAQSASQDLVHNLLIEEGSHENANFKDLALLETALRAYQDPQELAGEVRARVYLGQVTRSKYSQTEFIARSKVVLFCLYDFLNRHAVAIYHYLQKRLFPKAEKSFLVSNKILLGQAEAKERAGDLESASQIYEKYLKLYPDQPDWGFVALSQANILLIEKRWDEAEHLIGEVRQKYFGRKEEKISENMMKRMRILKKRDVQIEELLREIPKQEDEKVRDLMEFRLGLAYLSIYEFNQAKNVFEKLGSVKDANIRQRSRFYVGWIYKLLGNLDQSKDVLEKLIDEKIIENEMRLALHAQLADICYREGDVQGAEDHYKAVKDSLDQEHLEKKAAMQSWLGLAEIERNTMYLHMGDAYEVRDLSDHLGRGMGIDGAEFLILKEEMSKAKTLNLRDEAFRRLRMRQVEDAKNLFEKYMQMHPGDAWSHSGIATCYLLSGDLKEAEEFANQGYNREGDEYTASMLAYVDMLSDKLHEAAGLYQVALRLNADYFPAKFNLAYVYLKLREYQKAVEILEMLQQDFKDASNDEIKARIMNNLGIARWWMGQKEEAIQLFNHVLDIKPGFRDAEQNLRQAIAGLEPGGMAAMDMTEAERQ